MVGVVHGAAAGRAALKRSCGRAEPGRARETASRRASPAPHETAAPRRAQFRRGGRNNRRTLCSPPCAASPDPHPRRCRHRPDRRAATCSASSRPTRSPPRASPTARRSARRAATPAARSRTASAIYKKADRAAVFAGWRDMNDYMRENRIEPVAAAARGAGQDGRRRIALDAGRAARDRPGDRQTIAKRLDSRPAQLGFAATSNSPTQSARRARS